MLNLRKCSGRWSSSSSYISSFATSSSVIRSDRPVRILCTSEALRADSTRPARGRSLRREAAIYARSWFSAWVRSVYVLVSVCLFHIFEFSYLDYFGWWHCVY